MLWEQRTFNTSVDIDDGFVHDTIEPSNRYTVAEWEDLIDVGDIEFSKDEIARMPAGSAQLYSNGDGYSGSLEVFHELHCLVSRNAISLPTLVILKYVRSESTSSTLLWS